MDNVLFWLVLLTIFVIIVVLPLEKQRRRRTAAEQLGAAASFEVGKHLSGLSGADASTQDGTCAVVGQDFVFFGGFGREIGRIPRDAISEVAVEDKSRVLQRLGLGRMLLLGPFSLAFPKQRKQKESALAITWEDEHGVKQHTVFAFEGSGAEVAANRAASQIRNHLLARTERLRADEMKCPPGRTHACRPTRPEPSRSRRSQ